METSFRYEDSALFLDWKDNTCSDGQTILLSKSANTAKLFPVCNIEAIPSAILQKTHCNGKLFLASCNSGEIIFLSLDSIGHLFPVTVIHSVVWTDFVEISGEASLVLLDRSGEVTVGASNLQDPGKIAWRSGNIPIAPATGSFSNNYLVISDGSESYACQLSIDECKVNVVSKKLPYRGVINIECANDDVILKTCDNRKYKRSIVKLVESVKDTIFSSSCLSFPVLIRGINKYSNYISKFKLELQNMSLYLNQLSLAKCLLVDRLCTCIEVKCLTKKSEMNETDFMLTFKLNLIESNQLDFRWWQLQLNIMNDGSRVYLQKNLERLSQHGEVVIRILIPLAMFSGYFSKTCIKASLVLTHFYEDSPVANVLIYKNYLDILHFLVVEPVSHVTSSPSHFNDCIMKFNKVEQKIMSKSSPLMVSQVVRVDSNYLNALENMLPVKLTENVLFNLWYLCSSFIVSYEVKTNFVIVKLQGCDLKLVLAVRQALEQRLLAILTKTSPDVPEHVMWQAILARRIYDLERGKCLFSESYKRLYELLSKLLSDIPV